MKFLQRDSNSKRAYAKISIKKREELVKNVMDEAIPISKMAKKLRIKISTARLIIRKYKESGKFYAKNFRIKTSKVKTRPIPLQSENNSIDNSRKATTQQILENLDQSSQMLQKEAQQPLLYTSPIYFYYLSPWNMGPVLF